MKIVEVLINNMWAVSCLLIALVSGNWGYLYGRCDRVS